MGFVDLSFEIQGKRHEKKSKVMTKIKLGEISMIALFKTLIVSLYDI
jgi:hypothetical protein